MYPELIFRLFGASVELKSYALFSCLGALVGIAAALPCLHREGLKAKRALALLFCLAASFVIGARLFNFAINPGAYEKSLHIYSLRLAGLSVYGGIICSLGAMLVWARLAKTNIWPLLDALVLPFGPAFALARVGCYLNGCCAGKVTASFWGVAFPARSGGQTVSGILSLLGKKSISVYVYPTQLFEMALALLGLVPVLWLYLRKKLPSGAAFLLYGIWFSAMRLAILPLRSLPYPGYVTRLIYPVFYCALILAGLILLFYSYKGRNAAIITGKPEKN